MSRTVHPPTTSTTAKVASAAPARGANGGEPAAYHGIHPATEAGTTTMKLAARSHTGTCRAPSAIGAPCRCLTLRKTEGGGVRPPPSVRRLLDSEILLQELDRARPRVLRRRQIRLSL